MFVVIEKQNGSKNARTKVVESHTDALLWMAKRVKKIEKQARQPQDTYIVYDNTNHELCVAYDPDSEDWLDYRWKVIEMI